MPYHELLTMILLKGCSREYNETGVLRLLQKVLLIFTLQENCSAVNAAVIWWVIAEQAAQV